MDGHPRRASCSRLQWDDVGDDEIHDPTGAQAATGPSGSRRTAGAGRSPLLPPARVLDEVPTTTRPIRLPLAARKPLIKGTHGWTWRKVKAAARTSEIRWHDLRHFCATQLLELGLDHFAVSVQLGHKDGGALVMERYGHPSVDAAKRAATGLPSNSTRRETW